MALFCFEEPPLGQQLLPAPSARLNFTLLSFLLASYKSPSNQKHVKETKKFMGAPRGLVSGERPYAFVQILL